MTEFEVLGGNFECVDERLDYDWYSDWEEEGSDNYIDFEIVCPKTAKKDAERFLKKHGIEEFEVEDVEFGFEEDTQDDELTDSQRLAWELIEKPNYPNWYLHEDKDKAKLNKYKFIHELNSLKEPPPDAPPLVSTENQVLDFDTAYEIFFGSNNPDTDRLSLKRKRKNAMNETEVHLNENQITSETIFLPQSEIIMYNESSNSQRSDSNMIYTSESNSEKSVKLSEEKEIELQELDSNDSQLRKDAFKSYANWKARYLMLKTKQNNGKLDANGLKEMKSLEVRLQKGLLWFPNKGTTMRKIVEFSLLDWYQKFEKHRLLMLYQVLWGEHSWNQCTEESYKLPLSNILKMVRWRPLKISHKKGLPVSIFEKLLKLDAYSSAKKQKRKKYNKIMKLYSMPFADLTPIERWELYDESDSSDSKFNSNLEVVRKYEWSVMESTLYQQKRDSHPMYSWDDHSDVYSDILDLKDMFIYSAELAIDEAKQRTATEKSNK